MAAVKYDEVQLMHEFGVSLEAREIFLYDEVDSTMAMSFVKNMRALDARSQKPIVIHQYSTGGDCYAGMMIYDSIFFSLSPIVFITYGCAASMGSIIPQAVRPGRGYRISAPNCVWLIHETSVYLEHSSKGAISYIEANKILQDDIYKIYVDRCKNAEYFKGEKDSKIRATLKRKLSSKDDWWLTSVEAVQYGFCDAILGSKEYETIEKIKGYL